MSFEVRRVTNGPKHHLFGFHDLVMTNAKGDLALALEVDDISHPPLPGETCVSGVLDLSNASNVSNFRAIHRTATWNYPQGARQQWIGDADLFVCNDREDDGRLVARVSDACAGRVVDTLPFPVHCQMRGKAFYFNYDRVHACGGYGYHPGKGLKSVKGVEGFDDIPMDDGIFVGDLKTKEHRLLVAIAEVAACGEKRPVKTGYPHYLTHLMLNPSGTRLCFLHRYRVPDGGETTRLMTVGVDGTELRCLAKGFLSHFTWLSDDEIFIWGKDERALCKMREAAWLRIPGVLQMALLAKKGVKGLKGVGGLGHGERRVGQDKAFLRIRDVEGAELGKVAIGVLTEDGHPMACPGRLHYLVNDTYPNADGDRWLMFYDVDKDERVNVGQFRRLFKEPDCATFDWRASQTGMDPRVLKKFPRDLYLFARSGFHCDLHPRWSADGKTAFFDSIHEGTRQIYAVQG